MCVINYRILSIKNVTRYRKSSRFALQRSFGAKSKLDHEKLQAIKCMMNELYRYPTMLCVCRQSNLVEIFYFQFRRECKTLLQIDHCMYTAPSRDVQRSMKRKLL